MNGNTRHHQWEAYVAWLQDRGQVSAGVRRQAPTPFRHPESLPEVPSPEVRPWLLIVSDEAFVGDVASHGMEDAEWNLLRNSLAEAGIPSQAATVVQLDGDVANLSSALSAGEITHVLAMGWRVAETLLDTNFMESRGVFASCTRLDGRRVLPTLHPRDVLRFGRYVSMWNEAIRLLAEDAGLSRDKEGGDS